MATRNPSNRTQITSGNQNNFPDRFSDEKEHYKSVLSYFKHLVTLTSIFLGIISAALLFITFGNSREIKEDMQKVKQEASESVTITREATLKEISGIRSDAKEIAITAASEQIELAFSKNNIDSFILNVARKHMEPQVISILEKSREIAIDSAINKMKSGDMERCGEAAIIFQNNLNYKYSDRQRNELIKLVKTDVTHRYRPSLIMYMMYDKSKDMVELFKYLLLNEKSDNQILSFSINYLVRPGMNYDYKLYKKAMDNFESKSALYSTFIENAIETRNKPFLISFFNEKGLVDLVNAELPPDQLSIYKENLKNRSSKYVKSEEFNKTYFNTSTK